MKIKTNMGAKPKVEHLPLQHHAYPRALPLLPITGLGQPAIVREPGSSPTAWGSNALSQRDDLNFREPEHCCTVRV